MRGPSNQPGSQVGPGSRKKFLISLIALARQTGKKGAGTDLQPARIDAYWRIDDENPLSGPRIKKDAGD